MNRLVKDIGSGIGLAVEAIAHNKEKKRIERERSSSPNPQARSTSPYPAEKVFGKDEDHDNEDIDDVQCDEDEWALDAAAGELDSPPAYNESVDVAVDDVVASFREKHPAPTHKVQLFQPLPCPVILPQRRPKDKSRGFIRAYAPVLGEYAGIDQQTFLDFLDDFHKSSQASPIFRVINAGAMIAGFVPDPIVMATMIAVQVAAGTAQELQARYRTNTFLDQINQALFRPHGLYAMIMTFKPERPDERYFNANINDATLLALTKSISPPTSSLNANMRNIRLSSGVSKGELSLPQSAPLIYPALDAAVANAASTDQALAEGKQNALKSSGNFIADYLDRRAQAEYAGSNPNSKLASPPPSKPFASRYSDPNHSANSGSIVALLTGGHFDPKARKRARRVERKARRRGVPLTETDIKNAEMGRRPMARQGLIRRVLQKNVLYLMIVNLPTEQEMDVMNREMERENEGRAQEMGHAYGKQK